MILSCFKFDLNLAWLTYTQKMAVLQMQTNRAKLDKWDEKFKVFLNFFCTPFHVCVCVCVCVSHA